MDHESSHESPGTVGGVGDNGGDHVVWSWWWLLLVLMVVMLTISRVCDHWWWVISSLTNWVVREIQHGCIRCQKMWDMVMMVVMMGDEIIYLSEILTYWIIREVQHGRIRSQKMWDMGKTRWGARHWVGCWGAGTPGGEFKLSLRLCLRNIWWGDKFRCYAVAVAGWMNGMKHI